MALGAISLTIGVGVDGGFIDWAVEKEGRWPRPEELHDELLEFRDATLVDQ